MADAKAAAPSKRPQDSAFQQQRLKAWQPLLTPAWVIGTFTFVGALFLVIGAIVLTASNQVVEIEQRYDNIAACEVGSTCQLSLTVPKDMNAPIFVYYKLTEFYQNHRRYVKSRNDEQLRGLHPLSSLSSCDPLESFNGSALYPCGLIASSMFNDKIGNLTVNSNPVSQWTEKGIAWETDVQDKYKETSNIEAYSPEHRTGPMGPLPNVTDEHFIVWMRTAGLPTFRKLYARIPKEGGFEGFKENDALSITIDSNFPVKSFKGTKSIVLSTTSWLGGKNEFLGYAYLVVGIACLVLAAAFTIKDRLSPRKLGDMKYFNWRAKVGGGVSS